MKLIVYFVLPFLLFISCEKCNDKTREYNISYYQAKLAIIKGQKKWIQVDFYKSDSLLFFLKTEYYQCQATHYEKILSKNVEFCVDQRIVIDSDTIPAYTNLMSNAKVSKYISLTFDKYNFIELNNAVIGLKKYCTFHFKVKLETNYEFADSTIAYIY